jgi:outer membrane protein TolC
MKPPLLSVLFLALILSVFAQTQPQTLTLEQCLAIALRQNPDVLKARQEISRTQGVIVEARAPALPQLTASGQYQRIDRNFVDVFPFAGTNVTTTFKNQYQPWAAQVEATQLLYAGGRVSATMHVAKLREQIALLSFQRTVADTILAVRRAFYSVLLNESIVEVREKSLRLLEQQLTDAQHSFDAGAVPRFNVLRAEVELANSKPPLIRAQNNVRLAREALVKLLAIDSPPEQEFTGISFVGDLAYESRTWTLPDTLRAALHARAELQAAERQVHAAKENVKVAQAGYKPEVSAFADYGVRNTIFSDDIDQTIHGWVVGAKASWPLFDGMLTRGRVQQARAQQEQAGLDHADTRRSIEFEVRQAYSDFLQAVELLEAQKKTVEQAEESVRLAEARFRAGTGTQLDVLSAQTALTEARSNEIQALYDYNLANATLERVTGATVRMAE